MFYQGVRSLLVFGFKIDNCEMIEILSKLRGKGFLPYHEDELFTKFCKKLSKKYPHLVLLASSHDYRDEPPDDGEIYISMECPNNLDMKEVEELYVQWKTCGIDECCEEFGFTYKEPKIFPCSKF